MASPTFVSRRDVTAYSVTEHVQNFCFKQLTHRSKRSHKALRNMNCPFRDLVWYGTVLNHSA